MHVKITLEEHILLPFPAISHCNKYDSKMGCCTLSIQKCAPFSINLWACSYLLETSKCQPSKCLCCFNSIGFAGSLQIEMPDEIRCFPLQSWDKLFKSPVSMNLRSGCWFTAAETLGCCFFSLYNNCLNGEQGLPGRIAETGNIRWPMNFPPSSYTASLKHAREGKTT